MSTRTTIQVDRKTLELLKRIKKQMHSESYDSTIRQLILENLKIKESLFGVDRGKIGEIKDRDRIEERD